MLRSRAEDVAEPDSVDGRLLYGREWNDVQ
jgi:hypothetical protein